MKLFRILWIIPEQNGGIRSYGDALWPSLKKSWSGDALDPVYGLPELADLERWQPDLIHIQHEFGLFGAKIPGLYQFPKWVRQVRKSLPRTKLVATAHTVLTSDYRYPWKGRGAQAPARLLANYTLVPLISPMWRRGTWGKLSGVIVHSKSQVQTVKDSGCSRVAVIPHFVPSAGEFRSNQATPPEILVFGYLTPEKGPDIAIEAMKNVKTPARLILAGGLRREADRSFFESCQKKIRDYGLQDRVTVTGFVEPDQVDSYYERASVVLVPFRETSGSGSLAQAFSRTSAILASDLALNREMNERQPGSVLLFRSEDSVDCARRINRLLEAPIEREALKTAARAYAAENTIDKTIERHLDFYRRI